VEAPACECLESLEWTLARKWARVSHAEPHPDRTRKPRTSDAGAIEAACLRVIEKNAKQAEQLRGGKTALMGFFVGQVMKEMQGAGNPQMVNDVLKRLFGLG